MSLWPVPNGWAAAWPIRARRVATAETGAAPPTPLDMVSPPSDAEASSLAAGVSADAPPAPLSGAEDPPLCVDLDGTLALQDTLHEVFLKAALAAPLRTLAALATALFSRAEMKARLAAIAAPAPALIAYRKELLDALKAEKARGRRLVLATGADQSIAEAVAAELGLFDEAIGSKDGVNLTGRRKAAALVERFGEKGFVYVGDSAKDLEVWPHAAGAWVAGAKLSDRRVVASGAPVLRRFDAPRAGFLRKAGLWLKAMRLYQWVKNGLVFVPALSAGGLGDPSVVIACLQAFFCFGLCASGVYLINDLVDLDSDRRHPRKRMRPFARGALPAMQGALVALGLVGLGLGAALAVNVGLFAILALYLITTTCYSLVLKRTPMFDVFVLGGLYSLRLVAGGVATGITLSVWLLSFSGFLFLSLACLKRVGELVGAEAAAKSGGRGYQPADATLLACFGVAVSVASIIIFTLYITSEQANIVYESPGYLWGVGPLLMLWMARLWLSAWRGEVRDDPIVTVLRDPASWMLFGFGLALLTAAQHNSVLSWSDLSLGF